MDLIVFSRLLLSIFSVYVCGSQETYIEHRASVTKCRFAPGGSCVASCDIEGVVKYVCLCG